MEISGKEFGEGLLFGGILGGVLGYFLTRQRRIEKKKRLQKELEEGTASTKNLNESMKNFKNSLSQLSQTVQHIIPPAIDDTKKIFTSFQTQVQPDIAEIKNQLMIIQSEFPKAKS